MKILHVISNLNLAGAQTMCRNLTLALKFRGEDVQVVSLFDTSNAITKQLEDNGIKVLCLGKKKGADLSIFRKLHKVFKREHPDIIHVHGAALKYAGPASLFIKAKIVHTLHSLANMEGGKVNGFINRLSYKIKRVHPAALTPIVRDSISKKYRIKKENIPVVYNGVDLSSCVVKQSYEVNNNFTILHIGRFDKEKNHIGLINAFELFLSEFPDSNLNLIGGGLLENEIKAFVHEKRLDDHVHFLGMQSNVYPYLNKADIFALPSTLEGMPMTLIEAMGTGLPIVATPVGGVPDMLTDGVNAIFAKINDSSIADALLMYAKNEKLREKIGKQALLDSKVFSSQNMANSYYEFYKKILT